MNFISTNLSTSDFGFRQAVSAGLAPDGGLFVPEYIPSLDDHLLRRLKDADLHELAFDILLPFVKPDLTSDQLRIIIANTFSFEVPLRKLNQSLIQVIELFHGPTFAFKDIGAKFLAGCLSTWNERTTVLVATSGDTGGAIANGFFKQPGVRVVILYPKGKITPFQEQQIAGQGENIHAIAVEGDFDDCQLLVRQAFLDTSLREKINLTSANSINVARWLPQMIFYAIVWQQLRTDLNKISLCIPSGNYGNLSAAWLAGMMGFSFDQILAAHNANDTIPRLLETGRYSPSPTKTTLANAMDVSQPSNFKRLQHLQKLEHNNGKPSFGAKSVTDDQIINTIAEVWHQHQYLLDPHTATAWHYANTLNRPVVIAATAHPFKFEKVIIKALGYYPSPWRKDWDTRGTTSSLIKNEYAALKVLLLSYE